MAKKTKGQKNKNPDHLLVHEDDADSYVIANREALIGACQAALDTAAAKGTAIDGYDLVFIHALGGIFVCHHARGRVISAVHIKYEQIQPAAYAFSEYLKAYHLALIAAQAAENEELVGEVIEAQEAGVLHGAEVAPDEEDWTGNDEAHAQEYVD